jgi:hypothetical protein
MDDAARRQWQLSTHCRHEKLLSYSRSFVIQAGRWARDEIRESDAMAVQPSASSASSTRSPKPAA